MKPAIKRENKNGEFYITEGCFITELSNSAEDPDVSIARARVEPGVTTRWHRLTGTHERYCIISGHGLVEAGELRAQEVQAGDVVLIPAGCRQRISNKGAGDLIFLAICSPRFISTVYEDLEPSPNDQA